MKKTFFEYNMHKMGYIDDIKKDSIIVLDANALLNLYRYNNDNRDKFFEILERVQDRLFLTNQSVEEFYRNRLSILRDKSKFKSNLKLKISKEMKHIENIILSADFKGENSSSCQLLKYESELKSNLVEIIQNASEKIDESIDKHKNDMDDKDFFREDTMLDKIIELFDNKVNSKLDESTLEEIYKEGKERYKKNIPPGYEDLKKNNKPEPDCYGDLVIWNEMIEISKSRNKNILFVSDDTKEDWRERVSGQDLGPRKELIREFFNETGKLFYSFTTSDFIKHISGLYEITDTEKLEVESEIIREDLESSKPVIYKINNQGLKIRNKKLYNFKDLNSYNLDESLEFDEEDIKKALKTIQNSKVLQNYYSQCLDDYEINKNLKTLKEYISNSSESELENIKENFKKYLENHDKYKFILEFNDDKE